MYLFLKMVVGGGNLYKSFSYLNNHPYGAKQKSIKDPFFVQFCERGFDEKMLCVCLLYFLF